MKFVLKSNTFKLTGLNYVVYPFLFNENVKHPGELII